MWMGRQVGEDERTRPSTLPDRVANLFYTHGVFCSAHPISVITITLCLVLLSCLPLVNLPVPGNVPQVYSESDANITGEPPKWFSIPPIFVQQVIIKSAVSPWEQSLTVSDSIRGPLAQAFSIYDAIQNFQLKLSDGSTMTLEDVCTRVETAADDSGRLPQYSCLAVSPASLWRRNLQALYADENVATTVYNHHDSHVGKVSVAEILFGLPLRQSGIRRYSLKPRQRVLQFSVTVFLARHDPQYLAGLKEYLLKTYPRLDGPDRSSPPPLLHVHYAGDFDYRDFLPLLLTYFGLFCYIYFSVRKIELVTSKVGMALSAVLTVIASLLMSVGLCLMFGLDPASSTRGREVFPYLVITVGLENILILTKSVVSTASHLDAKIRLAQGLSKEGWSITKNLLTEVTILTCGLLTLVPAIQEFCMFAMVGLLCDFFLQMCLFTTILSLDIRGQPTGYKRDERRQAPTAMMQTTRHRVRPANQPARSNAYNIPKRLRLVYFWARTRIVQRMFMVCMVVWIGGILYSADLIQSFISLHQPGRMELVSHLQGPISSPYYSSMHMTNQSSRAKQVEWGRWCSGLAPTKWCTLVSQYNSSGECRLAVLPPMRLTVAVPPPPIRHTPPPPHARPWAPLADALDPADDFGVDLEEEGLDTCVGWREGCGPLLPSTPLELLLVTLLVAVSTIVVAYMALALYHCVCTRNYAQWRSGLAPGSDSTYTALTQVPVEVVPVVLDGHSQGVEWVTSDGPFIVSSCLAGDIKVWDSHSGQLLSQIDRKRHFISVHKSATNYHTREGPMSDYESGSPPPAQDSFLYNRRSESSGRGSDTRRPSWDQRSFADLSSLIQTDFSLGAVRPPQRVSSEQGFDFGPSIRMLYLQKEWMENEWEEEDLGSLESVEGESSPAIWCLDTRDNVIAVGTAMGAVEFWQADTGQFKCIFDDACCVGVTAIKMAGNRVVVARLTGQLDILALDWQWHSHRRNVTGGSSHIRCVSAGRAEELKAHGGFDLQVLRTTSARAHHQPITALAVDAGRAITASHDHTLKVISLVDQAGVFTLHGHCGPVTHVFIDRDNPLTAGSGSHDGMLCVWDLLTGACVFNVDGHDGPVTALTYSSSYVLSLGADDRLCIWDRFQGHLLNTLHANSAYCLSMVMISHNLLVTSKQGSLVVWDVRCGEAVRTVKLGEVDDCEMVSNIVAVPGGVACDYGRQLRVITFPLPRLYQDKRD